MTEFYGPLIERDIAAIPGAVRAFRDEHGSIEAYKAIGRFAVLAYSPSQHGKHAVLACLAAWALRDEPYFDDVVTRCAIYAAESRQPWSEPPIMTPPAIDDDQRGDLGELLEAIAASDRLRGERWLARRLDDADLARDYFAAAADDFDDLGHKLIVADAAWRLVAILGEKGRFAALRLGIWEMCAHRGESYVEQGRMAEDLDRRLVNDFIAKEGDIEAAHALFLLEAARGKEVEGRVRDYLSVGQALLPVPPPRERQTSPPPEDRQECLSYTEPVYDLAKDYAEYLKIHALTTDPAVRAAARTNLDRSHFDELTFA